MREIKDFSILIIGHIFQGFILIASTRIITSLLTPVQIGRISIIQTIAMLFFALFIIPPGLYMQRKIIEWNLEGKVHYYMRQYIYYLFLSGLSAGLIVLFIKQVGNIGIEISNWWIGLIIFGLIFFPNLNASLYTGLNIFKKRLWFIMCSNLSLGLSLLGAVSLVLLFYRSAEYWISGQFLGQILVIFLSGILFWKTIKKPNKGEMDTYPSRISIASDVFHFAWPIAIASMILWAQTQSYRFLLRGVSGIEVVGFFTVGFNLGTRLNEKFQSLFYNFYDPIFYTDIANSNKQEKAEAWNKYAKAFFPAVILLTFFICAGSPFIANIFVAQKFQKIAADTVLWGGITAFFLSIMSIYRMVAVAKLEMKGLLGPYTLGAFVALGGISVLSPWNPYMGTGLALSLGALATMIYLMIKMHRLLPVRFPENCVALSIAYSLPMVIAFIILRTVMPDPTLLQSIAILLTLGIYLLFAQIILAKDWLFKRNIPFIDAISKRFDMKIFK